jgi:hypothetical protein
MAAEAAVVEVVAEVEGSAAVAEATTTMVVAESVGRLYISPGSGHVRHLAYPL